MTRQAVQTVGGWEERIYGWGGEDDHMTIKIKKLIGHTHEIQHFFALHLHHQGSQVFESANIETINPHYKENLARIKEVTEMSCDELRTMCAQQFLRIGNPNASPTD